MCTKSLLIELFIYGILLGAISNFIGRMIIRLIDHGGIFFFIKIYYAKKYDLERFNFHNNIIKFIKPDGTGQAYDDRHKLYAAMFKEIAFYHSKFKLLICPYCMGLRILFIIVAVAGIYLWFSGCYITYILVLLFTSLAVYEASDMLR